MPIRKTKTKGARHQKIAPRPSQSAPLAPPALPVSQSQSYIPRPSPSAPPAPTTLSTSQPYSPLPPQLAKRMVSLIHLSTQIESLAQALSFGLFPTPSEQHAARTRMTTLRTKYTAFRTHVDEELTSLGYFPTHTTTPFPPSSSKQPPKLMTDVATTLGPHTAWHKHKYGPTSPKYTVDKALKRKAEKMASTPEGIRPEKKQRGEVESDYVETDCEGEEERKGAGKVQEEDTKSPPGPICVAIVPLAGDEKKRMKGWNWAGAIERGGCGRQVVESPMGTRRVGAW